MKIIKTYEDFDPMFYDTRFLDLGRFSDRIDKKSLDRYADGTYYYDGNLNFDLMGLNSLDEIPIRFKKVHGNFSCWKNNLISLEGAPEIVTRDFNCYGNNLISLQYAPSHVGWKLKCAHNSLISRAYLSNLKDAKVDYDPNPFEITDDVIDTVKKMTHVQQMNELDFFKQFDLKAFEMMREVLDGLGFGYGEETRSMVGVMNKDYSNVKNLF